LNSEAIRKTGKYGFLSSVIIFALVFAFCAAARAKASSFTDAEVPAALESLKRSLDLQTELTGTGAQIEIPDATRKMSLPERFFRRVVLMFLRLGTMIRETAKILLAVSLIVIALMIALHLRENLWSLSRARKLEFGKNEAEARSAALERMEHSQAEADDLARAGSFAEAMHVLLLRSVNEMRARLASPIAVSLTSREILGFPEMSHEARDVFARIVGDVEISRFGAHNPGEGEYLECRRNFDALTELLRGGQS
jgi:hypothetical protein